MRTEKTECRMPNCQRPHIRGECDKNCYYNTQQLSCWPNAGREDCRGVANCMECWLDWLKQEAK